VEAILSSQNRQSAHHIGEPSEIASARRSACDLAKSLGFNETVTGQVAIVVTEAGTNIAKHAVQGEILLRCATRHDGALGIEIIAIDAGPGIANLSLAMQDGVSTVGTYGIGLGTIQRLADQVDIYTASGKGMAICMTFWGAPDAARATSCDLGVVCLPIPSETVCGDAWTVKVDGDQVTVLVADGLGHGPLAAIASEAATMVVVKQKTVAAGAILQETHRALQGTRGAAVAVARLDSGSGNLTFAGVGNIAGCIRDRGASRHLISHNGIVGSNLRKVQEFVSPWPSHALLVMHSDGLGTRWNLDQYPGLEVLYPALIAAILYRDFSRRHDDVTVLVYREHQRH
jgi:anti-sigma regulatory factor (Ser/Thr protein kinase)